MPLELINDQLLTKATDVFSFGVLCYEARAALRCALLCPAWGLPHFRCSGGLRKPDGCNPSVQLRPAHLSMPLYNTCCCRCWQVTGHGLGGAPLRSFTPAPLPSSTWRCLPTAPLGCGLWCRPA
ncbi:hypothetical protein ABPG77_001129 [Micractinium sp. CCAP 211/92]